MTNNHHKLVSAGDNNNNHYRQYYMKDNKRSNFDVGASGASANPTDVTSSHQFDLKSSGQTDAQNLEIMSSGLFSYQRDKLSS